MGGVGGGVCVIDLVGGLNAGEDGGALGVIIGAVHPGAGCDVGEEGGDIGGGGRVFEEGGVAGTWGYEAFLCILDGQGEVFGEVVEGVADF